MLVYAISEAPQVGWGTFRTIGLLVVSAVLLAFFLIWEWREKEPLMPLGIFRIRLVAAANFCGFLLAGGMYGTFLLLTLYMQQVLHLSVLQTGIAFLATAGTAVVMAGPAQALTTRFGAKPVLVTGMSLLVAGCLWYTQISAGRLVSGRSASRLRRGRNRHPVRVHPDHDRSARRSAAPRRPASPPG